ncbi:MAG: hypothetical protein Fur005_15720 [Roseiflexaceae bacterium]
MQHTQPMAAYQHTAVPQRLHMTHLLLSIQSLVVILVSINRLAGLTNGFVADNQFLRWVDLHNMLTLPLISLIASFVLLQQLPYESPARHGFYQRMLELSFIVGVYLLAAGYGNHELSNYLHARFCPEDRTNDLCQIIIFNDDDFSHWVFFLGFVLMNTALLLMQALFPYHGTVQKHDWALLIGNGLLIGLGVFANLAFEEIGLDLYVVLALALLAAALMRRKPQPLTIYYLVAYWFGLIGTAITKLAG